MSHVMSNKNLIEENRCNGAIVPSARGHGKVVGGSSVDGMIAKDGRGNAMDTDNDEEEMQRTSLLAEKQSELEEVFDRHDTLVCSLSVWKSLSVMLCRSEKCFTWKISV